MTVMPNIPIIDLSGNEASVAQQLVDAAEAHGFIYIKNRGRDIPIEDVDGAFALSRKLFDAPLEEKKACTIQKNNRGWSSMHAETLDPKNQRTGDFKEAFNFAEFLDGKAQQPLPPTLGPDEPRLSAFTDSCRALCLKILHLLGIGLQVGDFFTSAHTSPSATTLRLLKYPVVDPSARSAQDFRAGAHSDYGSITLLFRLKGQAGLELQSKDGSFSPVPVSPRGSEEDPAPPILVNIGDLLSYWTNGLFRSSVHRVVFKHDQSVEGETTQEPRYSIAFFCHPAGDARLEPVPSERVRSHVPDDATPNQNPYAESKVLTASEHLFMRLKESYGQLYDDNDVSFQA